MLFETRAGYVGAAAILAGLGLTPGYGQAVPTADQRLRVSFYGLLSYVRPDFSGTPNTLGVTLGGTVDGIRLLPYTDLGIDLRGSSSHSDAITESAFSGGPRISYNRYRLQPYAEYMFGIGRGGFNQNTDPNYMRDYSTLRSYGGGLNFRLSRNFSLRADVQQQRWRFTSAVPYFHPVLVGGGLTYHLHLRSRTGPQ